MPSQVRLPFLMLLLSVVWIEFGEGFQPIGVGHRPLRSETQTSTPPPAKAAASSEQDQHQQQQQQQQRMRLLFPPTTRPTSIVFQDKKITTFEQRTSHVGLLPR